MIQGFLNLLTEISFPLHTASSSIHMLQLLLFCRKRKNFNIKNTAKFTSYLNTMSEVHIQGFK